MNKLEYAEMVMTSSHLNHPKKQRFTTYHGSAGRFVWDKKEDYLTHKDSRLTLGNARSSLRIKEGEWVKYISPTKGDRGKIFFVECVLIDGRVIMEWKGEKRITRKENLMVVSGF